jgi:hypothetical protein
MHLGYGQGIKQMRSVLLVLGLLLICGVAHAETDVFMRAVGFALTGSDEAEPKAIDRAKCVFAVKNDIFHLNNIHNDRLKIQGWEKKQVWGLEQWVTVSLHGDQVVMEETVEGMKDDGSPLMRQLREMNAENFKSHHYSYKEHDIHLDTSDQDRVKRAWEYVYGHGCVGKQSPF